jgi:hypothetical protein
MSDGLSDIEYGALATGTSVEEFAAACDAACRASREAQAVPEALAGGPGTTSAEALGGAGRLDTVIRDAAAAIHLDAWNWTAPPDWPETLMVELSPYETGVCPACKRQVEFAEISFGGRYPVTTRGRWNCTTPGCEYGPPA